MITMRGRVPQQWNDQTAAHITQRLQMLERALGGGATVFQTPATPTFGPGSGVVSGPPPTGPVSGGGDTTTVTNIVQERWGRTFLLMGA